MSEKLANRRIRLVIALFAIAFAVALARAGWLQAVRAPDLDQLALQQHRETVPLPARRGTLYDQNGVELAVGRHAVTVFADPKQIQDPFQVAGIVAEQLELDPESVFEQLSNRSKGFVYLARKVDPAVAAALEELDLIGVDFYPEERRVYPQGAVASEIVGFAGLDNQGLAGLESSLDGLLNGVDGEKTITRDPFGRTLNVLESRPARAGKDVYLTIDHLLQAQVERIMRRTRERTKATAATAVVMDSRTGGILAMAVEPGFDANDFALLEKDQLRNRAVTDTYEPGSTFKVVTVAAALERGDVNPDTLFTLPPQIQVSDRVIKEHSPRGTQTMSVREIISDSSNIGTVTLALGLGKQRLYDWIMRFGFGAQTGIEYPGETKGIVATPDQWSGSTIGTMPIGHGIAVTPVQMIAMYGAIANRGLWTKPHLVDHVGDGPKVHPKRTRILSKKTADQLRQMLRGVVRTGTGTLARVPGYKIAGKTGTAAKPDPVRGGYSTSNYVASFVGFVPASRPRLVITVTVDEPRTAIWGGVVAAPAFAEITEFALQYLEIPPDNSAELE